MSGCIVLSMTGYSIIKAQAARESVIEKRVSTPLGLGAALGGLAGKQLFDGIRALFANPDTVGAIQAAALFAVTLGTLIFTIKKQKIQTLRVKGYVKCAVIGLGLGMLSSFLGIGGGPINLAVLFYFFSMDTKTAAQNSLYIILFSQLASFLFTVLRGTVPDFPKLLLACMMGCGILGGIVGRRINRKINEAAVNKLFSGLMAVIMAICCYNFYRYL